MRVIHLILQSNVEDDGPVKPDSLEAMRTLNDGWENRADRHWVMSEGEPGGEQIHPTKLKVRVSLVECAVRPDQRMIRIEADVEAENAGGALHRLRLALGLKTDGHRHPRRPVETGFMALHSITRLSPKQIIGPMKPEWPVGRRLTDYSSHLGSYGQGGIGLSGWQLNGGSWIVLPISGSASWITLRTISVDRFHRDPINPHVDIVIDQRIVGAMPDQIDVFPPWFHRYGPSSPTIEDLPAFEALRPIVSRFQPRADGFELEAANGMDRWIFEMGDHLARPIYGGSKEPRLLEEGVDVGASFVMTHDCYLDV
jgi:hypothetical protein